jgi:hypothetical protein
MVVTLCGSTRFQPAFEEANYLMTMAGRIVLSVGFYPQGRGEHGETLGCTATEKIALDVLHKQKIDVSDEVFVLNVGGYIGESTRSEIDHAPAIGVPVYYLEDVSGSDAAYRRRVGYGYARQAKPERSEAQNHAS